MVPRKPFFEVLTEIQVLLGDQNPVIMAKLGRNLGERWARKLEQRPSTVRELFDMVATYLQNGLLFAEKCEVIQEGNNYLLKFGMPSQDPTADCRCILCCENIVKAKGGIPACPISGFVQGAFRVLRQDLNIKGITLREIRKAESEFGPGICDQHFIVTPRRKSLSREELAQKMAENHVSVEDIEIFHQFLAEIANESDVIQKHTHDWKHVIEVRVDRGPTGWIQADNGKFTFNRGHFDGNPDLILELDTETVLSVLRGRSATTAYEAGEIKINGRFRNAVKFQRIIETVRETLLELI